MKSPDQQSLLLRSDVSRGIEDKEVLKAVDILTNLGALIKVNAAHCFHGRVSKQGEAAWSVDPYFQNGGNNTGNHNVHQRTVLYASDQPTALAFAETRMWSLILAEVIGVLKTRVARYSDEERRAWLKRINDKERDEHMKPLEGMQIHADGSKTITYRARPGQARVFTLEDLNSPRIISEEAQRLYKTKTPDILQTIQTVKSKYSADVHPIITSDPDARLINMHFNPGKLSQAETVQYMRALEQLRIPLSQGSPYHWHEQQQSVAIENILSSSHQIISESDIMTIAGSVPADPELVKRISGTFNARQLAFSRPQILMRALVENDGKFCTITIPNNNQKLTIPLDLGYAARYFREAHIVGLQHQADSATLSREITVLGFLDLTHTKTQEQLQVERSTFQETFASIIDFVTNLRDAEPKKNTHDLISMLQEPHVKPDRLMNYITQQYPLLDYAFSQHAGNWEGFSLGEHTETVLRNFEENFADSLPVGMLAFMRLVIIVHDLGKPQAVKQGNKLDQNEYNSRTAAFALRGIGVSENVIELTLSIIQQGMELAFINQKRPNDQNLAKFRQLAQETLSRISSDTSISAEAYMEICKILQLCDGGAYTSMGVTRREGTYIYNPPAFNSSFEKPEDPFNARRIRYRGILRSALNP